MGGRGAWFQAAWRRSLADEFPGCFAGTAFVTVHPSALLRIKDGNDKQAAYRSFVSDLRLTSSALKKRP
jgi:hypothetical protein